MSPLLGLMAADVGRLNGTPLHAAEGLSRSPSSIILSPAGLSFCIVWMPSSATRRESSWAK